MRNVFIGYQNRIDEAALSLGVWSGGLPRSNLQDRLLSKVARTANVALASTQFLAALTAQRPMSAVALINTNLSRAAKYRVSLYTDAALTNQVYDSGWRDVFALWTWVFGEIAWEDSRFWDGRPTAEDLQWFPRDVIHVFDHRRLARYVKVELDDTTNADGYVQLGRAFIADGWTPEWNMTRGASIGHKDLSTVLTSPSGVDFHTERAVERSVRFELRWLSNGEAMNRAFDLQRIAKTVNEVLFVWDPDDASAVHRLSFLGRVRELDFISYPFSRANSIPYEIKEIL